MPNLQTTNARDRLRRIGQADLGAHIQISTGHTLWGKQREIAKAVSRPRSKVVVPSCNASGKTHLAARLALAFYDSFKPGTPCIICGGPCGGAKVITTSSKWEHLHDNLWGELRMAYPQMVDNVGFEGRLLPGDLRLEGAPNWWIIGLVAEREEGFQGYHAAHKLIIGDEATSIKEAVAHGITGLLASGDSRLCLILNPTTADTYAANMSRSPGVETIKITAWDTPHFSKGKEAIPEGSNLITPRFLDELRAQGMGEGTYEWTTRVKAEFWDSTDDTLIAQPWIDQAHELQGYPGMRALGIDMATYGANENVITYRDGNEIVWQRVYPSMRMETFWQGPVLKAIMEVQPHYVIYDADGVGAGVSGEAERVSQYAHMVQWGGQILPFRGALKVEGRYRNNRSMWWWALRRRLEAGLLVMRVRDPKLETQLTGIKYGITETGDIRVESKGEMRKRNVDSPDRADSMMYACALADDLPLVDLKPTRVGAFFGVKANDDNAMWERTIRELDAQDGRRQRGPKLKDAYELEPYPLDDWY